MGVIGLDKIDFSPALVSLFEEGKDWILSLWKDRKDQIKNLTILHKVIGRNDGFVVQVNCTHPESTTMFFAKIQHTSMDTVLMHHLLKNLRCGPDRFYITLLKEDNYKYHGVITEEVKDWTMASDLTYTQTKDLLHKKRQLTTTTFLLTILIELGRFGNIPNNRENWGFVNDSSIPFPHMSMIDFSRGRSERFTFDDQDTFLCYWHGNLDYLVQKWMPRCRPIEDLQLYRDRLADFHKSLKHGMCIEDEIQHFPFLQSREALLEVLQSACDETAAWLQDASTSIEMYDISLGKDPLKIFTKPTEHEILTAYRTTAMPKVSYLHGRYKALVYDYIVMVDEWIYNLELLLSWFPFPNKCDTPAKVAESSMAPVSDSNSKASEDGVTAASAPINDTCIPEMLNTAAL